MSLEYDYSDNTKPTNEKIDKRTVIDNLQSECLKYQKLTKEDSYDPIFYFMIGINFIASMILLYHVNISVQAKLVLTIPTLAVAGIIGISMSLILVSIYDKFIFTHTNKYKKKQYLAQEKLAYIESIYNSPLLQHTMLVELSEMAQYHTSVSNTQEAQHINIFIKELTKFFQNKKISAIWKLNEFLERFTSFQYNLQNKKDELQQEKNTDKTVVEYHQQLNQYAIKHNLPLIMATNEELNHEKENDIKSFL